MALSNRERVGRILSALKEGLGPFVIREYRTRHGEYAVDVIDRTLASPGYAGLPTEAWTGDRALLAALDTHACLHLMWRQWDTFQDKLGHSGRSYVSELIGARNTWAHEGAFTNDEAYRVADTAARLLKMVSAGQEAAAVEETGRDLLRLRFEDEADKARKQTVVHNGMAVTTLTGLKPWRDVVQPHPDVASGRYLQAEFAADLSQVLAKTAEAEYQDPVEFFRRTYLTEGLLALLVTGVKRLTAQGGDPVVQLQTTFGGGKTHSMLALYHLCGGKVKLGDFPGGERIAAHIGDIDLPEANVAVLVGTAFGPTESREYPEVTVHTLWGEMAYQLGGAEGYALVAQADQNGVSPGSDALSELFFKFGPCLIIVDELVAYARNLYGVKERLSGGTFESIMTFVQALTEAVRRTAESMLLISVPESDIEVGGEAGKAALNTLAHIVGRIESVWKPVTTAESFEIVRRRLFAEGMEYAARDVVVNAFGDLYRNAAGEFPAGIAERDYLDRMRAAYPIHPELFDRLYQDWSTLERFQRTRGVLRLMAAVIHQLWTRGDQSLLIMPGALPLDAAPIRNELLRYLPDTWAAVYETDIDGPDSRPFKIDGEIPALGRYSASRRVARAIFIGSAPSVAGQHVRGLEEIRIRLGCAQPGEPAAAFGDALRRMGGALTYLYTDGSRYWYDTRPTVNKLARDRAQAFKARDVELEIVTRLRKVPKTRDFGACHVAPPGTSDVADESSVRVVVLSPGDTHKRGVADSAALIAAKHFLESRGNAQRLYKNMLVFIAPDANDAQALADAARDYMAWDSINEEREELNLDAQQRRQVANSLTRANETVDARLRGAYSWLIVPEQPEPLGPITFQASRISGDDNFYDRAARKLRNDGLLIESWSPDILRMELERYIWNDERGWEVGLKQLWEYLAQYVYLPRLADREVLVAAVKAGVGRLDAPIAYATGKHPEGHHTGVLFQQLGQIYLDERSLLVHPDHIVAPPEVKKPEPSPDVIRNGKSKPDYYDTGGLIPLPGDSAPEPEPPPALTRYYGRVDVDAQRVNREIGLIVEEVIQRLTSQVGCEVEITVEIHARKPDGFDESTVRTINENSRTLKFEQYEFEG